MAAVSLSLVVPARNEAPNLPRLVAEIASVRSDLSWRLGGDVECIIVDDGSADDTVAVLRRLHASEATGAWLRCLSPEAGERGGDRASRGQSAAFRAGFLAARGRLVATMDADLQNDPADLPAILDEFLRSSPDMVQGDRSANRRDGLVRRVGSDVGRFGRRWILGDTIRDTGCSLRVMRRELAVRLPLELRGMHRFIPVLARDLGATVVEMPVTHRPRHAGRSNYGLGLGRAIPGLLDCISVRWMRARRRAAVGAPWHEAFEVDAPASPEWPELDMAPAPRATRSVEVAR